MVLNILFVTKNVVLLNRFVLSCLKWVDTYIHRFENGAKNMSFMIKNDDVVHKYNEIWDKIKNKLSIKFYSMPVYDETYIKAKVREFDGVIKTNFLGNEVPKENVHYTYA